jgi:hypothetical protein
MLIVARNLRMGATSNPKEVNLPHLEFFDEDTGEYSSTADDGSFTIDYAEEKGKRMYGETSRGSRGYYSSSSKKDSGYSNRYDSYSRRYNQPPSIDEEDDPIYTRDSFYG